MGINLEGRKLRSVWRQFDHDESDSIRCHEMLPRCCRDAAEAQPRCGGLASSLRSLVRRPLLSPPVSFCSYHE